MDTPRETPEELYKKFVVDHGLERDGLFKAIKARFNGVTTVLYPGCSVHITPSFYFPHVVYVDKGPVPRRFFTDNGEVLRMVEAGKHYKRSAFVRFLAADFTGPLPLREGSFDLLISIFAGGISRPCSRFLKVGGLLLTDNHHDDAGEAARDPGLELIGVIHERRGNFSIEQENLQDYFVQKDEPARARTFGRQMTSWPEYAKKADYYLFNRTRPAL
ncbi:MAG: hypothetical protein HUU21_18655 [Polyangiaceae bacterium]|nr:hypothetical protein [Polyangiaceae bacterium]